MQQTGSWACQYPGCQTSAAQIAALRSRKPGGFPHDEDPALRVCTVCRRLPLLAAKMDSQSQGVAVEELDRAFIAGIREDLASVEENEKNIQALSQVFRYYARNARQLSQVLIDFARQCFPWELIHVLHLVDDILLMDNSGRYKVELADRVQGVTLNTFRKAPSDVERREVVRMIHAWQQLKIFDMEVLEAIHAGIRGGGEAHAQLLDEAIRADEEEEEEDEQIGGAEATGGLRAPRSGEALAADQPTPGSPKKRRVWAPPAADAAMGLRGHLESKAAAAAPVVSRAKVERIQGIVDRLLSLPADKPFQILGIAEEGASGHDIRTAYRRLALLIHPDKNPGMEVNCQEALIKLQQGREQAETQLVSKDVVIVDGSRGGETRSAATAAAANATVDSGFTCKYPGCDLPPCKQCANQCCTRNITHCHMIARTKGGTASQCLFHPPPRAWARNA